MSVQLTLQQAKGCGMSVAFHAAQRPAQMAISSIYGDRTFAELNSRINQLVRVLRGAGLKPDDGVAMLLRNRPEFVEVYFACLRAGLRVTSINWHLTGDNASCVVGNSEARVLSPTVCASCRRWRRCVVIVTACRWPLRWAAPSKALTTMISVCSGS